MPNSVLKAFELPDLAFESIHTTFQHQQFVKTAPVRRLFRAGWFQLLLLASLAAVTTEV